VLKQMSPTIILLAAGVLVLSSSTTDLNVVQGFGTSAENGVVDICLGQNCHGRGRCYDLGEDFLCDCNPGFYGRDCALDLNQVKEHIAWVHIDLGPTALMFDQGLHTLKEECTKLREKINQTDEYLNNLEPINGTKCHRSAKLDLQLIVDGSGSIENANFGGKPNYFKTLLHQIADTLIDGLDMGENKTRVAFSQFSGGSVTNTLLLTSNYEKDAVKDQIKSSPYISTGTYAAKAMEEILPKFQEHQRAGDDIARVCIVFTDGQAIDEDNLEEASQKWAENNVTVFAVGIGSEVERETLRKIAGNESRILWAEDFDQLANITNDLKKIVCVAVGNDCEGRNCSGNGVCEDWFNAYTCACDTGFTGKDCETNINDCEGKMCSGNGICQDGINDYICICNAGYKGENCETNINECEGKNCSDNGFCQDGINNYICTCHAGYAGKDCEININDCEGRNCSGRGDCQDDINDYFCECDTILGYTGKDCEIAPPSTKTTITRPFDHSPKAKEEEKEKEKEKEK